MGAKEIEHLLAYKMVQKKWQCIQHTSVDQTPIPCVPWIKTKREDVKSGSSGALKPDRLGLSCKANKSSDAGAGDLGGLPTHETSPCFSIGGTTSKSKVSTACNNNQMHKLNFWLTH